MIHITCIFVGYQAGAIADHCLEAITQYLESKFALLSIFKASLNGSLVLRPMMQRYLHFYRISDESFEAIT